MASDLRSSVRRGVVEFLAIFLAVTLSFLADDWRDSLGEERQATGVVRGIENDLELDLSVMRESLALDSIAAIAGIWLHDNWSRASLPADSLNWANQSLISWLPYLPIRAEYESAKAAGRIQYITDEELRSQITAFYEEGQARLSRLTEMSREIVLELGRLLRPYQRYVDASATPPRRDLAPAWERVRLQREIQNAVVEVANIRRIRARETQEYLADGISMREAIARRNQNR